MKYNKLSGLDYGGKLYDFGWAAYSRNLGYQVQTREVIIDVM
jgi:hypothetical protein